MHSAQRILVLCVMNNKRKEGGDSNLGHGEWTVPPRAEADALTGSGGQKGGAAARSSAALTLAALSGPDSPCHLQGQPGPGVFWTRVCSPPCPVTVTWSSDALRWAGESISKHGPLFPFPGWRAFSPLSRHGTRGFVSPGTCCGSQIETALGPAAGGGRAGGRCRSPTLPLLLPGGRLQRSPEMPQKRGASRRGSALLRSAGAGGCPPRATVRRPPKPSLGKPPRACRRADPPARGC